MCRRSADYDTPTRAARALAFIRETNMRDGRTRLAMNSDILNETAYLPANRNSRTPICAKHGNVAAKYGKWRAK
jgi:hypothetical protein